MATKTFDARVQAQGYCCAHAAIRLLVRPEDSISKIAKTFGVCTATVKNQRRLYREGKLPCPKRDKCLRVLWLMPKEKKE